MSFTHFTSLHFIFIPAAIGVGIVLGFIMGSRAARDAFAMQQKRDIERTAVKAARDAKKAARAAAAAASPDDPVGPADQP